MSEYLLDGYRSDAAAYAPANARAAFIRNTYAHVAGAVAAFIALEAMFFQLVPQDTQMSILKSVFASKFSWLIVLGAFLGVSFLANWWAQSETSVAVQYAGLSLYVVAEAVIFLPILFVASNFYNPQIIAQAGIMTGAVAGGLTLAVFTTKKDFSFLGPVLCVGGLLMLATAIAGIIFGFSLGIVFCFFGVALASGYLIYDTSNVLHHYRTTQHVAAALALFSSIATLFWYILRIFMFSSSNND